jgi:hypothetical protein
VPTGIVVALVVGALVLWLWLQTRDVGVRWELHQGLFGVLWLIALAGNITWAGGQEASVIVFCSIVAFGCLSWTFFHVSGFLDPRPNRFEIRWQDASSNQQNALVFFALLLISGSAGIAKALTKIATGWSEEPFMWFEGVSVWPTHFLRLLAAIVAVFGVVRSQSRLRQVKVDIARRLHYPLVESSTPEVPPRIVPPEIDWKKKDPKDGFWITFGTRIKQLWLVELIQAKNNTISKRLDGAWWLSYCAITEPRIRFMRVMSCMLGYLTIFGVAALILTLPPAPVRGDASRALDTGIFAAAIVAYTYLLFFVFDATVLACTLIGRITTYAGEDSEIEDCCALKVINDLSNTVARLMYLPFSVLFMLFVSRNSLFDAWGWSPLILLFFGSGLVVIVFTALLLQQRARRAKQVALAKLDDDLEETLRHTVAATPLTSPSGSAPAVVANSAVAAAKAATAELEVRVEHAREKRRQIEGLDAFVFQSWHHNPIFRAIMIPLGGLGSLQLLEKLNTLF